MRVSLEATNPAGTLFRFRRIELCASAFVTHPARLTQAGGEKVGKMIRNAEVAKVPVVAVVGPRDIEAGVVSVRTFASGERGQVPVDDFLQRVQLAIANASDF